MRNYIVYGDYALTSEQSLFESPSRKEAVDWATRYCRRDLGGYESIEVISFNDDGEAVTHFRKTTED